MALAFPLSFEEEDEEEEEEEEEEAKEEEDEAGELLGLVSADLEDEGAEAAVEGVAAAGACLLLFWGFLLAETFCSDTTGLKWTLTGVSGSSSYFAGKKGI